MADIELPGVGSIAGFSGNHKSTEFFLSFTGFTEPGIILRCGGLVLGDWTGAVDGGRSDGGRGSCVPQPPQSNPGSTPKLPNLHSKKGGPG